ncbi:MAG: hypothetical protein RIS25_1345 [Actinomycetota bacterium]
MTRFLDLESFVVELEAIGFVARDLGLIHSALERPSTTLMGKEAYPAIELKCAAQTESLARNDSFYDGNKRIAWIALNHLLIINGYTLEFAEDEAFTYIHDVVSGSMRLDASSEWIRERIRPIQPSP